ncbi:FAD/NAD(P)-binding protein [Mesorhizobium sp. VNQ89]|uniref:FAD/NAD(P)-binding protein n=1 Tax=Mesorhizobium quangtriensis TaxID=3157709 RepID=UPI0032B7FE18
MKNYACPDSVGPVDEKGRNSGRRFQGMKASGICIDVHALEYRLKTFVIIGGGASGVLIAAQLLSHPSTEKVTVVERGELLGAGVAYGTENPGHLLNVPAAGMSAFPDKPQHFLDWLAGEKRWMPVGGWTPGTFVPRRLYRDYVAGLLAPHREDRTQGRLAVIRDEAVDVVETPEGVEVTTKSAGRFEADAAILATGNEGPVLRPAKWRHDFWSTRSTFKIPREASVVIVGTGLSMIDSVVSLLDAGHSGNITAISRRGLLPQPHGPCKAVRFEAAEIPFGSSLSRLLHWLRGRIAANQGDWRGVVDGLRPFTQRLWQSFPPVEKRRFLRHARPWWDVHRHRMAPQVRGRIDAAAASGQLTVTSGRLAGVDEADNGVRVSFVPRGSSVVETMPVQHMIECRGHNADLSTTRSPLLQNLLSRGIIRQDALRLGVDVAPGCAVIDAQGNTSDRIFAVGPVTTGAFWEIVAVPDIRQQARTLAAALAHP